jgi:hypothetical protein
VESGLACSHRPTGGEPQRHGWRLVVIIRTRGVSEPCRPMSYCWGRGGSGGDEASGSNLDYPEIAPFGSKSDLK